MGGVVPAGLRARSRPWWRAPRRACVRLRGPVLPRAQERQLGTVDPERRSLPTTVAPSAEALRVSLSRAVRGWGPALSAAVARAGSTAVSPARTRRIVAASSATGLSRTGEPPAPGSTARRGQPGRPKAVRISTRQSGTRAGSAAAASRSLIPGSSLSRSAMSGRRVGAVPRSASPAPPGRRPRCRPPSRAAARARRAAWPGGLREQHADGSAGHGPRAGRGASSSEASVSVNAVAEWSA